MARKQKDNHSAQQSSWLTLALYSTALMLLYTVDPAWAAESGERYGRVCSDVIQLMQGPFGAMLTAAAGVGAICAAAMGGFKMAWTLIVVAVGSFILEAYVELFFQGCGGAGG